MFKSIMLALSGLNWEEAYETYKLYKRKRQIDKKYRRRKR